MSRDTGAFRGRGRGWRRGVVEQDCGGCYGSGGGGGELSCPTCNGSGAVLGPRTPTGWAPAPNVPDEALALFPVIVLLDGTTRMVPQWLANLFVYAWGYAAGTTAQFRMDTTDADGWALLLRALDRCPLARMHHVYQTGGADALTALWAALGPDVTSAPC